MYVGHALLAFVVSSLLARRLGAGRHRTLSIGLVAGAFAVVPDVDSAYTFYAVAEAGPENVFPTTRYVWTAEGWLVHRAMTHSLLVGAAAAIGLLVAAIGLDRHARSGPGVRSVLALGLGFAVAAGLLVGAFVTDGSLGVATMVLYTGGAALIAVVGHRRGVPPHWIGAAAAIGLLSHPFGDVFMGRPPAFFYPLSVEPTLAKVTVAADPTLNLLALYAIELALGWAALGIGLGLLDRPLRAHLEPIAGLGLAFGATALVIRPPTLEVAYHFTLGTITTGLLLGAIPAASGYAGGVDRRLTALATGLAAISLALLGYIVAYLVWV